MLQNLQNQNKVLKNKNKMKNKVGNKYLKKNVKVPTSLIIKLFAVQKQVRVSMKREDF